MGVSLTYSFLALARGRQPDWSAAERAIEDLDLATVYDTGDELFPLESWLDDAPEPPAAQGVYELLSYGQDYLYSALGSVRRAIHEGHPELAVVELPDDHVFMTGGMTTGDSPELLDDFAAFGEGGLARAAGFDEWTEWCPTPPENRRLYFTADESRCVDAVRAFLRVERLAKREEVRDSIRGLEPEGWGDAAQGVLERATNAGRDAAVEALLDFTGWLWALIDVLHGEAGPEAMLEDETPRLHVLELLDPSFAPAGRRRSANAAGRQLHRRFAEYARLLPALRGRGDLSAARPLVEEAGPPLARALAVELTAHVFAYALFDIADLVYAGAPRKTKSAGRPSAPMNPQSLVTGPPPPVPWMAIGRFDDEAARAVAAKAPTSQRKQLEQDLEQWEAIFSGSWNASTDTERIGGVDLWLAYDERHSSDWSPGQAIRRLGDAGILDAAGVLAWGPGATADSVRKT